MRSRSRGNTLASPDPLLILAWSGRALAQSAQRGGWRVVVADAYADADARACAYGLVKIGMPGHGFDEQTVSAALPELAGDYMGLIYGGGMEAMSGVLAKLQSRCPIIGNPPEVARRVKHPRAFFAMLDALRIPYPETCFSAPRATKVAAHEWLVKHAAGRGGGHVQRWDGAPGDDNGYYFQRYVCGSALSVLFAADGKDAAIVGYNTQWSAGQGRLAFAYAGAINRAALTPSQRESVAGYACAVTRAFGLRGLNGLDFVVHQGMPLVLEINPRPTATCELYEPEAPDGMVATHLRACAGELPDARAFERVKVRAHKIVYAQTVSHIASDWQWPRWCRDIPQSSAGIAAGAPVCSVHAEGEDVASVQRMLNARCESVLHSLAAPAIAA